MLQIREILRQKLALKRSHRDVARSLSISPSSVAKVVIDAAALGLELAIVEGLTDSELGTKLYPKTAPSCLRAEPDCAAIHLELRRPCWLSRSPVIHGLDRLALGPARSRGRTASQAGA